VDDSATMIVEYFGNRGTIGIDLWQESSGVAKTFNLRSNCILIREIGDLEQLHCNLSLSKKKGEERTFKKRTSSKSEEMPVESSNKIQSISFLRLAARKSRD